MDLDLDIQSHDLYLDGPPFERFDRLRRELPVFRHEDRNPDEIDWFWAITRYDDIVTVSRQWDTYSSAAECDPGERASRHGAGPDDARDGPTRAHSPAPSR